MLVPAGQVLCFQRYRLFDFTSKDSANKCHDCSFRVEISIPGNTTFMRSRNGHGRLLSALHENGLDVRELANAEVGALASVTGHLHTAEWRAWIGADIRVN